LFVPTHGFLQAVECMTTLTGIARIDIDMQVDATAGHGGKAVLNPVESSGHQCEQVAGLTEGVFPDGTVSTLSNRLLFDEIAVAEQDRIFFSVGFNGATVGRHDIWPIEKPGDA